MEHCDRTLGQSLTARCALRCPLLPGLHSCFVVVLVFAANPGRADTATVVVQANQPGAQISSNLFGIFFEEINNAGDGGLYAERVRNRSFEDSATSLPFWSLVIGGSAVGQMNLDRSLPLSPTNAQSLRLTMTGGTGSVGAANGSYWGISISQGANYNLSFYARATPGFAGPVTVSLENAGGSSIYAQA